MRYVRGFAYQNHINEDGENRQQSHYFHNDQIGIPKAMTDIHGNLLWYGEYTALGRLKKYERVYKNVHQPFRLQNQYYDEETGLHYNLMWYYVPEAGRFVNQDPIGLLDGGDNFYKFAVNAQGWIDPLDLSRNRLATVGKTPSKVSPTDRAVMQRMLSAKELCGMTADQISSLRRISDIPTSAQFWDVPTKSWQPIKSAHMGHVGEDVVDYWNRRENFLVKNRLKSGHG